MVELVVLGLVAEQPRHGYDVEAAITGRRLRLWTPIAFSSIYHVLNRLARADLLKDEVRKGERGEQRVYRAGRAGRRVLRTHLEAIISDPARAGHDIELALMFAQSLGRRRLLACLARRAERADAGLKEERRLREYWRRRGGRWTDLIFRHTIAHMAAERAWTLGALAALRPDDDRTTGGPKCRE